MVEEVPVSMELSNRQRRILSLLLENSKEISLGALAEDLEVSPRTVHREILRLGPVLADWGLTVRGRSGQGVQLEGEPEHIITFKKVLGGAPDRGLSATDRRWMAATILLDCADPVKFYALEQDLGIGTVAVRAELDALEPWLASFDLRLVRRRGFGVAVLGPEFRRRIALGAALAIRFSEPDLLALFRDAGAHLVQGAVEGFLFERYPKAVVTLVDALVDEASRRENWDWAPSAGLTLTLHLVTTLQRVARGQMVDDVPAPKGDRGPARRLLGTLTETFGVPFPAAEIDWTAFELEAAKPNRSLPPLGRPPAPDLVRGVRDLVEACGRRLGLDLDHDATLQEGLTAHWGPALARLSQRIPITNALVPEILRRFPDLVQAVGDSLTEVFPGLSVPMEETGYLVLHFAAALERKNTEAVPFRALIVCSSGIGTSHMLASRIRAEVPEIQVMASLSWSEVKGFSRDRYDLLVSTVPLPLAAEDYVVVSPLLDDQGLRDLKDHLRRRRHRLMAARDSGPPVLTLGDLKDWNRSVGMVLELVENLLVFDSLPVAGWWKAVARNLEDAQILSWTGDFPGEGHAVPSGDPPVVVLGHPGVSKPSLTVHPLPTGGRIALVVHPEPGFPPGGGVLGVLAAAIDSARGRAALAQGTEVELKAVLAQTLGRHVGPRNYQGD